MRKPLPGLRLRLDWLWGLGLFLGVVLIYLSVWQADFLSGDDDTLIRHNQSIIGPQGFAGIWTTSQAMYSPLTVSVFWLEHALWGLNPLPYHLVNVVQHALTGVLLWRVLLALRIPGAWLGAALWAFHPVMVESVAWISEMKNTQSGMFYLLSILFFVRWLHATEPNSQTKGWWNYSLVLLFSIMAILSKSSTVVLPMVFILCAWWVRGRLLWRDVAITTPVFIVSAVCSILTSATQPPSISLGLLGVLTWPQKLALAGDAIWFYLWKLVYPYPLIAFYPQWKIDASRPLSYLPSLLAVGVLALLWRYRKTWGRPAFFAYAYFLIAALPVLGFVYIDYFSYTFVADHFQYLASMGPLALIGASLGWLIKISRPSLTWFPVVLYCGLLLLFSFMSWWRTWAFGNDSVLWLDTLTKNPDCWVVQNNLGMALIDDGIYDEAITHLQKALATNPIYAEGHNNLGNAFIKKGQIDEAILQYRKALEIDPNYAIAHYNLGNFLAQKGQTQEAIVQLQKALAINSNFPLAHYCLGSTYFATNQLDKAQSEYQAAIAIEPDFADAYGQLGAVYLWKGQPDNAIAAFNQALKLDPNSAVVQKNMALIQSTLNTLAKPTSKEANHATAGAGKHP